MNRYFTKDDKRTEIMVPASWWSRPAEYQFILDNIDESDIVLDAGCGIEHPLKDNIKCKKLVCIDKDKRIEELGHICADILDFKSEEKFDKIILCGVLEETQDYMIEKFKNLKSLLATGGKIIITATDPILLPKKILEFSKKAGLTPTSQFNEEKSDNLLYHSTYGYSCFNVILEREKKAKEQKISDRKTKVEKGYKTKDI